MLADGRTQQCRVAVCGLRVCTACTRHHVHALGVERPWMCRVQLTTPWVALTQGCGIHILLLASAHTLALWAPEQSARQAGLPPYPAPVTAAPGAHAEVTCTQPVSFFLFVPSGSVTCCDCLHGSIYTCFTPRLSGELHIKGLTLICSMSTFCNPQKCSITSVQIYKMTLLTNFFFQYFWG